MLNFSLKELDSIATFNPWSPGVKRNIMLFMYHKSAARTLKVKSKLKTFIFERAFDFSDQSMNESYRL